MAYYTLAKSFDTPLKWILWLLRAISEVVIWINILLMIIGFVIEVE